MKKLLFALFLISVSINISQAQDKRLTGIDTAIARILKEFNAVGVTVSVVEKNNVLLAQGYGYKDLENKKSVTPQTLFQIGSSTKAFTTTLMGMLMDEKLLDFNKPVSEYMPELKFKDDNLTKNVTTTDMMTHRTGLPRHDLAWYLRGVTTSRAEVLKSVRYFEASAGLRETWQYNNFMFMAQGALAEKLTGKTWEKLVQERIFDPLSMKGSKLSTADMLKSADYALGYSYNEEKKKIKQEDAYHFGGMEPAGSIVSNAKDMSEWLKLWINVGKYNGKELFSKTFYEQAIKTQMSMTSATDKRDLNIFTYGYGFGWFIKGYKGHHLVEHGGNIDGFSTSAAFYPNDSIGIFVSVNQNGSAVPSVIRNWISDRLLNVEKTDWVTQVKPKKDDKKEDKKDEKQADLGQKKGTKMSHNMTDYVGKYKNDGYGTIVVFKNDTSLFAFFGKDTARLAHYHYDVFNLVSAKLEDEDEGGLKFRFNTGYDGEIVSLDSKLESALKGEIIFTKEVAEIKVAVADLKKYEGEYTISGATIKVAVKDNALRMTVPGQPEYELLPSKADEFKLKGLDGYAVRFDVKEGKATAAYSIQPNGTFKMARK
jgi:CubicO group peptidase (beta-lactamase class C family)